MRTAKGSSSVVAVLLDSGNLILSNTPNASESEALWQSFDFPTNTWLPGGKIKLNKITKKPTNLTAWKNSEDPATGIFSLELDPNGTNSYFMLWNKTQQYWTSSTWNGQKFSLVPEMRGRSSNFLGSKVLRAGICFGQGQLDSVRFMHSVVHLVAISPDDSNGQTLFLKLAASEFSDSKSNKGTTAIVHHGGNVISLLDSRLDGDADVGKIARVIKIGSWCVQDDEAHRPSMGQVVQILEGVLDVTLPPIPRSLQAFIDDHEDIVFFTDSSSTHNSQKLVLKSRNPLHRIGGSEILESEEDEFGGRNGE
ncbi:hypothetical protein TSUD_272060 [Trifolium subterraneum]|uniref:Bulb-type lectin domain-containing protein n=1 Tax=Trifolium subterraneum TaxID=3900 RepID=A0A2Z6PM91_TRISU|nr:hypothetical protein TSUD_272060 [Trifolium subterraneum]